MTYSQAEPKKLEDYLYRMFFCVFVRNTNQIQQFFLLFDLAHFGAIFTKKK